MTRLRSLALLSLLLVTTWLASSSASVEPPTLLVERFDSVGAPYGDAPLAVRLAWRIGGTVEGPLRCKIDLDGDGTFDEVIEECPRDSAAAKVVGTTYATVGEHAAKLVEGAEGRTAAATATFFANHIDWSSRLHRLETLPGFVSAEAPLGSTGVTARYADVAAVPKVVAGDLVMGASGSGYLIRVATASTTGSTLTLTGTPAQLNEAIENGFYGARDLVIPVDGARCLSDECKGLTLLPIEGDKTGSGPSTKALGRTASPLVFSTSGTFGVKVPFDGSVAGVSGSIFVGLSIKKLLVDIGFFKLERFELEMTPSFQGEIAYTAKTLFEREWSLGKIALGAVPIGPIVIQPMIFPVVRLKAEWTFNVQFGIDVPVKFAFDAGSWSASVDPKAFGDGTFLDPNGIKTALTTTACLVPKLNLLLYGVAGPYVAPTACAQLEAAISTGTVSDVACKDGAPLKVCLSGKLTGGGEAGLEQPWFRDASGKPYGSMKKEITLAELDLFTPLCLGKPADDAPSKCTDAGPADAPDSGASDGGGSCSPKALSASCADDRECSCGAKGKERVCARNTPSLRTCIIACHSDADCPTDRPTCDTGVAGGVSEDEPHWQCVKCPTSGPPLHPVCAKCEHDLCSPGTALSPSCSTCAKKVCAADEYCCTHEWTLSCRARANELCGAGCPI